MKTDDFMRSKWMAGGLDPDSESKVRGEFHKWTKKVNNPGLLDKAFQLWEYLVSGKSSAADKALIVAALLYLICPVDLVPDFIPVIGWLDDAAIATAVIAYLGGKVGSSDE
jgi:uncharacterized membrane protein YkvA (DUF1232 family)